MSNTRDQKNFFQKKKQKEHEKLRDLEQEFKEASVELRGILGSNDEDDTNNANYPESRPSLLPAQAYDLAKEFEDLLAFDFFQPQPQPQINSWEEMNDICKEIEKSIEQDIKSEKQKEFKLKQQNARRNFRPSLTQLSRGKMYIPMDRNWMNFHNNKLDSLDEAPSEDENEDEMDLKNTNLRSNNNN